MNQQQENVRAIVNNQFLVLKTLGSGHTAKAKLGVNVNKPNELLCLKIMKDNFTDQENLNMLQKEVNIMKDLKHENIIRLHEYLIDANYVKSIQNKASKKQVLVMEYAKNNMLYKFIELQNFSEKVARAYFQQLIEGLSYLHNKNICHRDLKPENILLDENFVLKIADFGYSAKLNQIRTTYLGTKAYMPPEILQRTPYDGGKADIFTSGVILFVIYSGHPLFKEASENCAWYKLLKNNEYEKFWGYLVKSKPQGFFTSEFRNLIEILLKDNPNQRPTIEQIKNHPWYKGPVPTRQEIIFEFRQRADIINQKTLQEENKKKLAKQQANFQYRGIQGFRSLPDPSEFEVLNQTYKNLKKERQIQSYIQQLATFNDIITVLDADFVLKTLLLREKNFSDGIKLHDSKYKLTCVKVIESKEAINFVIELFKIDEEKICVDVRKKSGDAYDFIKIIEQIKQVLRDDDEDDEDEEEEEDPQLKKEVV